MTMCPNPLLPQGLVAAAGAVLRQRSAGGAASPDALILGADGHPASRVCLWRGEPLELTATGSSNMLVLLVRTRARWSPRTPSPLQGVGRPAGRPMTRSVGVHICNLRQKLQQKAGGRHHETVRSIARKIR